MRPGDHTALEITATLLPDNPVTRDTHEGNPGRGLPSGLQPGVPRASSKPSLEQPQPLWWFCAAWAQSGIWGPAQLQLLRDPRCLAFLREGREDPGGVWWGHSASSVGPRSPCSPRLRAPRTLCSKSVVSHPAQPLCPPRRRVKPQGPSSLPETPQGTGAGPCHQVTSSPCDSAPSRHRR